MAAVLLTNIPNMVSPSTEYNVCNMTWPPYEWFDLSGRAHRCLSRVCPLARGDIGFKVRYPGERYSVRNKRSLPVQRDSGIVTYVCLWPFCHMALELSCVRLPPKSMYSREFGRLCLTQMVMSLSASAPGCLPGIGHREHFDAPVPRSVPERETWDALLSSATASSRSVLCGYTDT